MKGWTILAILIITSGCTTTNVISVPFCPPDRPDLEPITVEEQRAIVNGAGPETLRKIGQNDLKLKGYIIETERRASEFNREFGVSCTESE